MFKKTLAVMTMALLVVPAVGHAAAKKNHSGGRTPVCAELPISTDAHDIHVGSNHIHIPGRSNAKVCAWEETELKGTPTATAYPNCGNACYAIRIADVRAYQDLRIEISYKEDGEPKSVPVDPDPVHLTRDIDEVCISNHAAGTPDPCVVTLTSPSGLRAKGGVRQVDLSWSAAGEAYGRTVETTYEVWRSTSGELGNFEQVAEGLTETSFLDADVTRNTTYSYYVVAVDTDGNRSGGSNVATATTQ